MIEGLKEKMTAAFNVDVDVAVKELGISRDAYERIMKISVVSTVDTLAALEGALQSGDMAAVQRAGHELKGVYANLRLTALSEAARLLDEAARSGAGEDVRRYSDDFRREFTKLKQVFGI